MPPTHHRCPEGSARVQCWPLEQLTLTGIVWGRTTDIASDHVVVTEEYLDFNQELITVQTRMALARRG